MINFEELLSEYRLHPEFLGIEILDVNQKGALDSTLLHIAARTGRLEHIRILVAAGACIDARGDLGNTPLHEAALCGAADAVDVLLSLGADAKLLNEFNQTAFKMAGLGEKASVIAVLKRHGYHA